MPDKMGLYQKYNITDSKGYPVEGAFVLTPSSDKHAKAALQAYAKSVKHDNPELAFDLMEWLLEMETI